MRAAAERVLGSPELDDRTVVIQGVGGVGRPLAGILAEAGARVVVTDVLEDRARQVAEEVGGTAVSPADAYATECDIFAPCAVGAVLNPGTIPRLRCAIVAGSANNQLDTDEDADRLAGRGIVYVPDFIINAGGAVAHGILEFLDLPDSEVEPRVRRIGETVGEVLDTATAEGSSTLAAAVARAHAVIERGKGKGA
jgi:glutamate dehydrogenase/leucine dehydrogenase